MTIGILRPIVITSQANKIHTPKKIGTAMKKSFLKNQNIPIDIAVMEKTKIGTVVPLNVNWTDIGNWKSLWEYETKNGEGNYIQGKVFLKNVSDSFFKTSNNFLLSFEIAAWSVFSV